MFTLLQYCHLNSIYLNKRLLIHVLCLYKNVITVFCWDLFHLSHFLIQNFVFKVTEIRKELRMLL